MRYHFTPVRMTKINNTGNNRCCWGYGEGETLLYWWWERKLVQPLWKTVWSFLKKLKIELSYDPAIALLGIYPKHTKMLIRRGTCTPMFIAVLSTIYKLWKEPKCPSTDNGLRRCCGAWVAQLVGHLSLDLGSGHDLMVCESEPCIELCADSLEPA